MRSVALEGFCDLDGQFPGRCQYQHLRIEAPGIQSRQQGTGKSGSLARASLRLPQHITALQKRWNCLSLDRGGLFVANFVQCL